MSDPLQLGLQAGTGAVLSGGTVAIGGATVVSGAAVQAEIVALAAPFLGPLAVALPIVLAIGDLLVAAADFIEGLFGADPATCGSLTLPSYTFETWGCSQQAVWLRWFMPSGAEVMVAPGDYPDRVQAAVNWVKQNPEQAAHMGSGQLAQAFGILVDDAVAPPSGFIPGPNYPIRPLPLSITPGSVIPGASGILRPLQIYAASATLAAYATMLPIWQVTMGASFPALTDGDQAAIVHAVQPIHDGRVAIARAWALSQITKPSEHDLATRFDLLPVDAQPICDAWKRPTHLVTSAGGASIATGAAGPDAPGASTTTKVVATGAGLAALVSVLTWWELARSGISLATAIKHVSTKVTHEVKGALRARHRKARRR